MDKIKRSAKIWDTIEQYMHRNRAWATLKTVAVVSGLAGCGKTTLLLDYFKGKKHFYFSFDGLEESIAERLLAEKVAAGTGVAAMNWDEAFIALSNTYRYIILDDLAPLSSYKRFKSSFYEHMCRDFHSRPLVILIAQPTDNLSGLVDNYDHIRASYFSVPEVMKLFPTLSKFDILGLSAISGGIPKILTEYIPQISFEDNIRYMLRLDSAFCGSMPYLMEKYFRRPEVYHSILCAIAHGYHRISEIGKFTDFAYNKCDNYVSALVAAGILAAEKEKTVNGAEKTLYSLTNFYFRLWYLYVYQNRAELVSGGGELAERIVKSIPEQEVHAFLLQKAFAYVNHHVKGDLWSSFRISDKVVYESVIQVLDEPDKTPQSESRMWVYCTGNVPRPPPIVLFEYQPSRAGEYPKAFLKGAKNFYLLTDAYAGYNAVEGAIHCACFAHTRRRFEEAMPKNAPKDNSARIGFEFCQKLFMLEREFEKLTPEERLKQRHEQSKPVLDKFYNWIGTVHPLAGSKLAQAIGYAVNQKEALSSFLLDGCIEISTNRIENCIRPFSVGRKNYLFAATVNGARASAIAYSIIESARKNGLNPFQYLLYLFNKLPTILTKNPNADLSPFFPWADEVQKKCKYAQDLKGQLRLFE